MVIQSDSLTSLITKRGTLEEEVRQISSSLEDAADLDPLMDRIGDARYVLLGEASHGTSEYYQWRARLSKRLIQEKGFSFICVEGDCADFPWFQRGVCAQMHYLIDWATPPSDALPGGGLLTE